MLVVDRNVFTQLQVDQSGLDFMELSANLIRAHHLQCGSTPSILDSETTSKGLSPTSLGFSPPSYEDIFGEKNCDLPPSYSELSFLFRQRQINDGDELQVFRVANENQNDDSARTLDISGKEPAVVSVVTFENEKCACSQNQEDNDNEDINEAGCSTKTELVRNRLVNDEREIKRQKMERNEDIKESSL